MDKDLKPGDTVYYLACDFGSHMKYWYEWATIISINGEYVSLEKSTLFGHYHLVKKKNKLFCNQELFELCCKD